MELTLNQTTAILNKHSEKDATRLGNLENHDVSASSCIALFLCPKFFMVGILGSLRACWFRDPVYQPSMPAAQSLVTFGGGNLKLLTEAIMPKSHTPKPTQKDTQTNTVSLKSIFSLLTVIKTSLPQALPSSKQSHFQSIFKVLLLSSRLWLWVSISTRINQ